jgi:hypothetical protein
VHTKNRPEKLIKFMRKIPKEGAKAKAILEAKKK